MYGFSIDSLSVIVADRSNEIEQKIKSAINCRFIKNDSESKSTLMCICSKQDVSKLQHIVEEVDENIACASLDLDYSFGRLKYEADYMRKIS